MKLRNKRTGEIGYTAVLQSKAIVVMDENAIQLGSYTSLAELNAEWCDVPEEPKEYWYISDFGYVFNHEINNKSVKSTIDEMKSIGNYFLSREEAELAVRKLKAWKRLKDKGFHVTTYYVEDGFLGVRATTDNSSVAENWEDIDSLLGGEE